MDFSTKLLTEISDQTKQKQKTVGNLFDDIYFRIGKRLETLVTNRKKHFNQSKPKKDESIMQIYPYRMNSCECCKSKTILPVLCMDCLEDIENLQEDLYCPWYIQETKCASRIDIEGEHLKVVGCGGKLRYCEMLPEFLRISEDTLVQ